MIGAAAHTGMVDNGQAPAQLIQEWMQANDINRSWDGETQVPVDPTWG